MSTGLKRPCAQAAALVRPHYNLGSQEERVGGAISLLTRGQGWHKRHLTTLMTHVQRHDRPHDPPPPLPALNRPSYSLEAQPLQSGEASEGGRQGPDALAADGVVAAGRMAGGRSEGQSGGRGVGGGRLCQALPTHTFTSLCVCMLSHRRCLSLSDPLSESQPLTVYPHLIQPSDRTSLS